MNSPRFSSQISVGNILQIIILVAGLAAAWFAMDQRSQDNSSDLAAIQADLDAIEVRMREVETEQARADERFSSILTILGRIDTRLERIEANQ